MDIAHFNIFYRSYLKTLRVKYFYKNQLKYGGVVLNLIFVISLFITIVLIAMLTAKMPNNFLLVLAVSSFSILICLILDKIILKRAIKKIREKQGLKIIFPSLLNQFKYHLWRKEINDIRRKFSVDKALSYLEIELMSFCFNKNVINPLFLMIFSAIIIAVLWRLIDDLHLNQKNKIAIDLLIFYVSYTFVKIKFFIMDDEKKLLIFKQFLLRLKSEE